MVCTRIVILSLLLWATASHAENKVVYVYDGDTVKIRDSFGVFKLRLAEIDAPERNQEYGLKSRRALMSLCQNGNIHIKVRITGTDQYHRNLGSLRCNDIDAASYLVEHGAAWHYAQYSNSAALHQAELKARQLKLGLWSNAHPTPPWVWRHAQMQH